MKKRLLRPIITALLLMSPVALLPAESGWVQSDTNYFTIIYQDSDQAIAAEVAGFADDIYEDLSGYLGVDPGRRVPVVIRGSTADANAHFTYLPTRIVLHAATPSTPIVAPSLDQWLRWSFTHELTHYLQISDPAGWGGALSRIFGRSASLVNLVAMPHWLAEGLAIHTETAFSDGGRGQSPVFAMQYTAALLADEFWSFDQSLYGSDFAPRSRVYVGGYVMADYIVRRWGIDSFMALSRDYLRHPFLGLRRAIRRTLGVDSDEFYSALIRDLESGHAGRELHDEGVVVTPDDGGYWFLVRGGTQVYGAPPTGYSRLLAPDAWEDGVQAADIRGGLALDLDPFSLSTSSHFIAGIKPFASESGPGKWEGFTDLVLVDRSTGRMSRVTRGRRLYHAALSADDSFVIAVERVGAYSRLVRIDTSAALHPDGVTVIWEPGFTYMAAPAISPDGRDVVLSASTGGEQDLYAVSLESGLVRQLSRSAGVSEFFPTFVSANTVWFTADPDGLLALYELDLESGRVAHLLTDPDGVFYATPVADGAIYASYSYTGPSVKMIDSLSRRVVSWPDNHTPNSDHPPATVLDRLPTRRYTDWPRPELWLPFVYPGRAESGNGLEVGALLAAGSVLEKNMVLFTGRINVASLAPTLSLQLLHTDGPWDSSISIATRPGYLDDTGLRAQLQSAASFVLGREIARWGLTRTHSVGAAGTLSLLSESAEGSRLPDFFAGPSRERLGAAAALTYGSARETRVADLFGPAGVTASVTGLARMPLDSADPELPAAEFAAVGEAGIRIPAGSAMVDLGVTAATPERWSSIGTPAGIVLPLTEVVSPQAESAIITRIGLDSPAWLLDLGWRGFNLTRLGASGYLRQVVDYGESGLEIRDEISAGVELTARAGYLSASFMPTVGIVVTVPYRDPAATALALTFRNASSGVGFVIGSRR